jgi:translation elongation factor EF-Ts
MTEISAAAVKALRDKTDLPMMLCKKALIEAGGDQEKAIDILKKEVGRVKEKRADNPTEPANIIEKIVEGQLKTFYDEAGVLTIQPFAKENSKTVSQALAEQGLKATKFIRWAIGRQ